MSHEGTPLHHQAAPPTQSAEAPFLRYRGTWSGRRRLTSVEGDTERLLGWSEQDLCAEEAGFDSLLHPADAETVTTLMREALQGGQPYQLEYRLRHRDGHDVVLWDTGRPCLDPTQRGGFEGWLLCQSGPSLVTTHEVQERVTAGIAHDLRNLLSVVDASLEALVRRGSLRHDPLVEQLSEATHGAARLVEQLGRLVLNRAPGRRRTTLNEAVLRMSPVLRALAPKEVTLELDLSPELSVLYTSPVELEQLVLNLTLNAIEATHERGSVRVGTRNVVVQEPREADCGRLSPGRYVSLEITDRGSGIEPQHRRVVFEQGFSTKGLRGTGLSTVRRIAEQQGGAVEVHSEPGDGTRFVVLLPVPGRESEVPPSGLRRR